MTTDHLGSGLFPPPRIWRALVSLQHFCAHGDWSGYDPYDALKSPLFSSRKVPVSLFNRLVTQAFKHSPVNLRPMFGILPSRNIKGVALFLRSWASLRGVIPLDAQIDLPWGRFYEWIRRAARRDGDRVGWGYDFDWESRYFFLSRRRANAIVTSFVGEALLDLFEQTGQVTALRLAEAGGRSFLDGFTRTNGNGELWFAYSGVDDEQIHNVNLLGAAFCARLSSLTGDDRFVAAGRRVLEFSLEHLAGDGSWSYGTRSSQQWIDHFHTAYNLVGLQSFMNVTGDRSLAGPLERAFSYYRAHLFGDDLVPLHTSEEPEPVDIHSLALGILTLTEMDREGFGCLEDAERLALWTIRHFRNPSGSFCFQRRRALLNRIPYMRWGQAWMFFALCRLLRRLWEQVDPRPDAPQQMPLRRETGTPTRQEEIQPPHTTTSPS